VRTIERIGFWLGCATVWVSQQSIGAVPHQIGGLTIDAPIAQATVSADGQRMVVQAYPGSSNSSRIYVVDTSVASRPRILGSAFVEGVGKLALSDDASRALMTVVLERDRNRPTKHAVILLDISDPRATRIQWRREVSSHQIVLAPDASAYAVSSAPNPGGYAYGSHPVIVHWVNNSTSKKVDDVGGGSYETWFLSNGGNYLIDTTSGMSLVVHDLRFDDVAAHRQSHSSMQRYNCAVAMLSGARFAVSYSDGVRVGVFSIEPGLPRNSVLTLSERLVSCDPVSAGGLPETLFFRAGPKLARIDLKGSTHSFPGQDWILPASTEPLAISGDVLFAMATNAPNELLALSLSPKESLAVNWSALSAAHDTAMIEYNRSVKAKRPNASIAATQLMEGAGISAALEAAVTGISAKNAAAILNDYGFLLTKSEGELPRAERFIRHAIAIDPERTVAYLNLADVRRQQFSKQAKWAERFAFTREIDSNYRKYVKRGGKPSREIEAFLSEQWSLDAKGEICSAVARETNAGHLNDMISHSAFGVEINDQRVDLHFSTEGSARVATIYAFDSATDRPAGGEALLPSGTDDLWGGDQLRLLEYGGQTHVLYYRGIHHPVSSRSVDGKHSCQFSVDTQEIIGSNAVEPKLCDLLRGFNSLNRLPFHGEASVPRDEYSQRYAETTLLGSRAMPVFNDGVLHNLIELNLSSGAGAGCEATLFDLVDKDAAHLLSGEQQYLVAEMQGLKGRGYRFAAECGNDAGFFEFDGKIYFETKPKVSELLDQENQYHRVTRIQEGKVVEVCEFRFESNVSAVQ
jgi:hypothetical protein